MRISEKVEDWVLRKLVRVASNPLKGAQMIRRWPAPVIAVTLALGSMLATGGASAAVGRGAGNIQIHSTSPAHAVQPGGPMIRASRPAPHAGHRGTLTTTESINWSGYAATGANGTFTGVSASWIQPASTCNHQRRSSAHQFAAFWAGLDGYNNGTVEQIGTDSDCKSSKPVYYGWYEMYPAGPVFFDNPVEPADLITASVTFSGTSTYTLVLTDNTQGWTQTITTNQVGLARSSAEVITEAPSNGSGPLPLADFGTVTYGNSAANASSLASQNPIEIVMVDENGMPKDSTTAINAAGGFGNTWIMAR